MRSIGIVILFAALVGCGSKRTSPETAGPADAGVTSAPATDMGAAPVPAEEAGAPPAPAAEAGTPPSAAAGASIGSATMQADGTIVMQLRAEGPGPVIGDAQFVYPPGHAEYRSILEHLGGLAPGETKPVPPWPEEDTTTP